MEAGSEGRQGDKVILIVEDAFDNREIMRTVVEDVLGYSVVAVRDGAAALQAIAEHRPDLILMDLMMPVLDGFQVINEIKSNPQTANIPVLAVSALSRTNDRERAIAYGAADYVTKPFDIDELTSMIERYV